MNTGDEKLVLKNAPTLENLRDEYSAVVIGGGITGAGVFRDLALHGISTLLLDKKDFSSQTSRASSKMLHGGIRYLENFDFGLVKEALAEKNLWIKLTPHLVQQERFCLPVYQDSPRPLWMIRVGLKLYDLLSRGKNPAHQIHRAQQVLEKFPELAKEGLKGAGEYSDAIMDDLRLTLEVIYDGLLESNQSALNHASIVKLDKDQGHYLITVYDELARKEKLIKARHLIFTTGPFTDQLLPKLGIPWEEKMLLSKGSHFWLDPKDLPVRSPLVMSDQGGRVIFVIPRKEIGKILVGTTEVPAEGDFFDQKISEDEILYLKKALKRYIPDFSLDTKIYSPYAGLRPLVALKGKNRGKTSRLHKVYGPLENVHVILGGKYTTFRTMAQDVTSIIVTMEGKNYNPDLSKSPLRQKSEIYERDPGSRELSFILDKLPQILKNECVRTEEDLRNRLFPWPSVDADKLWNEVRKNLPIHP